MSDKEASGRQSMGVGSRGSVSFARMPLAREDGGPGDLGMYRGDRDSSVSSSPGPPPNAFPINGSPPWRESPRDDRLAQ